LIESIAEIVLINFLFFDLCTKAQTSVYVPELATFDTAMLNLINHYNVPGGQLAITYHGRLVYNRGFGYADTTTHTLVQSSNIFRIASVSKPITAIAMECNTNYF
jgi:CubicO group peptidase (beta-lactamase class C family)